MRELTWSYFKRWKDSANVQVIEGEAELAITCTVSQRRWGRLAPLGFFALWAVPAYKQGGWIWIAAGLFAMGAWWWNWRKPVEVQLLASTRGLEMRGNFGGGYEPVRFLLWDEIIRLEYQSGSGGDDEYTPAGLWSVGPRVSTCVLPGLDKEQAYSLAETIYQKYPDAPMAVDTPHTSIFRDDLISLNLSTRD